MRLRLSQRRRAHAVPNVSPGRSTRMKDLAECPRDGVAGGGIATPIVAPVCNSGRGPIRLTPPI
jgi:hypothetical protein